MGIETILITFGVIAVVAILVNVVKSKRRGSNDTTANRTTTPAVDPGKQV